MVWLIGASVAGAEGADQTHDHGTLTAAPRTVQTLPASTLSVTHADLPTLEKEWGIKLVGLRQTAAGYMLDLRFRVLDSVKAAHLLGPHITRQVIVEKSGAVLKVPSTEKLGSLRSAVRTPNMVKQDRIYVALFANPGRHVKPGDRVTLVLGDFRAAHLAVQ
jgi:hypothetical protein